MRVSYCLPCLIELLEFSQCIWDKTSEEYNNKKKKSIARGVYIFRKILF